MNIITNGKIAKQKHDRMKRGWNRSEGGAHYGSKGTGQHRSSKVSAIRITGGEFRGRELVSPHSDATHPMGSRERMALFNSIGPRIKDSVILDAFSGTGSLGLEALSRGAAHVTFVEKDHKAAAAIRQNIKKLAVSDRARIFEVDVEEIDFDQPYDIVIADPPYDYFKNTIFDPIRTDRMLATLNRLSATASQIFILSHPAEFDPHALDAELISSRAYAGARISIYAGDPKARLEAPDIAQALAAGENTQALAAGNKTHALETGDETMKLHPGKQKIGLYAGNKKIGLHSGEKQKLESGDSGSSN